MVVQQCGERIFALGDVIEPCGVECTVERSIV